MNKLDYPFDHNSFLQALLNNNDSSTTQSPFEDEPECGCGGNCSCGKDSEE